MIFVYFSGATLHLANNSGAHAAALGVTDALALVNP